MPDPISRALLNRVFILFLLSAGLYHLPEALKSLQFPLAGPADIFSKDAKAASTDLVPKENPGPPVGQAFSTSVAVEKTHVFTGAFYLVLSLK